MQRTCTYETVRIETTHRLCTVVGAVRPCLSLSVTEYLTSGHRCELLWLSKNTTTVYLACDSSEKVT